MTDLAWIFVAIVGLVAWWLNDTRGPTPPDADHLDDEDRAKALDAKRRRARAKMNAHGIRSILEDRPYTGSMHNAESLKPRAKLIALRGRKA